ncbi:MAG: flagellar hook-basal body complex protein, partial [Gammaproteobacteria bacterium]
KKASQPTATVGGTNPQKMGGGVEISSISPNMAQGNIVNTGNPLDLALEGEGYFVASDGARDLYSRAGSFAVDADSYLVDPTNGYHVQRIGSVGESDAFQTAGVSKIRVPYDVAMAAKATTTVTVAGNLSADATLAVPQTNALTSNVGYTTGTGTTASSTTLISALDQYTGTLTSGTLTFSGIKPDGTALGSTPTSDLTMPVTTTTTLADVLTWLNTNEGTAAVNEVQTVAITGTPTGGTFKLTYAGQTTGTIAFNASAATVDSALEALSNIAAGDVTTTGGALPGTAAVVTFTSTLAAQDVALMTINTTALTGGTSPAGTVVETTAGRAVQGVLGTVATASLVGGKIRITDVASGYSRSDFAMAWTDGTSGNTLTLPAYFENSTVGGDQVKYVNTTVYDSQGGKHVMSAALTRTDTANTWDMVLTSITGDVSAITAANRRIRSIEFSATDGSYSGLNSVVGDTAQFAVTFARDPSNPQTFSIAMGTTSQLDGLTQFAGNSTAVARGQNGYEAGRLSTVSVDNEGTVIGAFSNGIKKDIATVQIALFQNPAALESVGGNYFDSSANSGEPVATQALTGGAGSIHGGSLEKSNADVATEFVQMIQAQNGFQASARTIRVANDILRELTNIIR